MHYISKAQMKRVIRVSFFCILMMFLTAQFTFLRGVANLKPMYVLNIGMDMVSMMMGYMLFVCFVIDVQKNGSDLRYLMLLLITVSSMSIRAGRRLWQTEILRWLQLSRRTFFPRYSRICPRERSLTYMPP